MFCSAKFWLVAGVFERFWVRVSFHLDLHWKAVFLQLYVEKWKISWNQRHFDRAFYQSDVTKRHFEDLHRFDVCWTLVNILICSCHSQFSKIDFACKIAPNKKKKSTLHRKMFLFYIKLQKTVFQCKSRWKLTRTQNLSKTPATNQNFALQNIRLVKCAVKMSLVP